MSDNKTAHVHIDTNRIISPVSPLLFSGFAEHMGRCIYGGIYEPGSPHADENGLRRDVLAALRELNFRSMRYPGGNFLSGYRWEDGVGPRDQRPARRDLAWQSIETNQFGTDEFIDYCAQLGTAPMLGVNMGTGSIQDAANLVEYCNAQAGTKYADMRVANGHAEPHGVQYWCLGNEMDGRRWQIGHLEAGEYGRKALEAAKMMRWHDPDVKLVLCGTSTSMMPTYPEWDRVALEHCYEQVDYHSMHHYAGNRNNDTDSFLATTIALEEFVDTLEGVLRYVKAKTRSKREIYLSWDEWNISYNYSKATGEWRQAPRLAEDVYNLEDALMAAQWLSLLLRRADVLKIACLAQIVNVIAPILTETDALLKQSIFYPFLLFSRLAKRELARRAGAGAAARNDAVRPRAPAGRLRHTRSRNRYRRTLSGQPQSNRRRAADPELAGPPPARQRPGLAAQWQRPEGGQQLRTTRHGRGAAAGRGVAGAGSELLLPPLSFTALRDVAALATEVTSSAWPRGTVR